MFGNWPNRFYPVTENNGTMIDAFLCVYLWIDFFYWRRDLSEEKNALSSFGALFGFTDCIFGDAIDSNHFTNFVS